MGQSWDGIKITKISKLLEQKQWPFMFITWLAIHFPQKKADGVVTSHSCLWYYSSTNCTSLLSSGGFPHHPSHLLHKPSDWFIIQCRHYDIYRCIRRLNHFLIYNCTQRLFHNVFSSGFSSLLRQKNVLPRLGFVLCLFTGIRVCLTGDLSWMLAMWWRSITLVQNLPSVRRRHRLRSCRRRPRADRERSEVCRFRCVGSLHWRHLYVSRSSFRWSWLSVCDTLENANGCPSATGQLSQICISISNILDLQTSPW